MRPLSTFDLDDRGVAHVRERLTDLCGYSSPSLEAFCLALRSVIDNEKSRVWTVAPPETRPERLYRFAEGGLLPENLDMSRAVDVGGSTMMAVESLREEEVARVCATLQKSPDLVGVIVDPMPRRGDPLGANYAQTIFYVDDTLYHLIDGRTPYEAVDLAMSASPFWSNLVVLSSSTPQIDAQRTTSEDELGRCAAAAVEIQCSAYDGEGFVVWRRA